MSKVSENGKDTFFAVLALDGKDGLSVEWGTVGFSLRTKVGFHNVPICWGYNKVSTHGEVIEFKFSKMKDIQGSEALIQKFRKILMNFEFIEQYHSGIEVKLIFEKKLTNQQNVEIVTIIGELAREIHKNGIM